jgi:MFS family permease
MIKKIKINSLFLVYLLGFFFAFHTALPTYINSSFISNFIPKDSVGVIYIIGSILTIISFFLMPFVLRKFGNYKTSLFLIILEFISLLGVAFLPGSFWLLSLFMVNLVTIPLVYFSTDIFLEGFSCNNKTGRIRGIYLTSVNLAWAVSPLIAGLILTDSNYWKIYLASTIFLIPAILILITGLNKFKDSRYEATHIFQTTKLVWKNKNLRNIFMANFLLFFFYSWMTIYMPLYLHDNVGFSWSQIGIIFSVMLLPFVFVQIPLGRLADKVWGEKEIMSLGFIIMAISTGLISFIAGANMALWAAILFITRIGAATVEIMCDTYFFKKVDCLDTNIISFFRMTSPLAYILGPFCATIMFTLFHFNIQYLFLVLGLLMFAGLVFSLALKDTK